MQTAREIRVSLQHVQQMIRICSSQQLVTARRQEAQARLLRTQARHPQPAQLSQRKKF